MLWPAAHKHLSCRSLYHGTRYRIVSKEVEAQERTGRSGSDFDQEGKKETPVSAVKSNILYYMRVVGTYNSSPAAPTAQHTNVFEINRQLLAYTFSREMDVAQIELLGPRRSTHYFSIMDERDESYQPRFSRAEGCDY